MSKPIKYFTPVNVLPHNDKIYCESKILTLGSCFSEHIGNRLSSYYFNTVINPFGTIFNPISIAKVLDLAIDRTLITSEDVQSQGNRYFHYDFHSSFDNSIPEKVEENINKAIKNVGEYIQNIDFLVLTFGTSIVYKLISNGCIVSNCHKVPNSKFRKEFLSSEFMEESVFRVIQLIKRLNSSVKIILTVSPVRHTKEGLINNSWSKSRLVELCHNLVQKDAAISYFPAFEIMMDELRDYRYYASDLIHPSDFAVDIIWTRFVETYFDATAIQKVQDIGNLNSAKNHMPFDPLSEEHQNFKEIQLNKIERFSDLYPEIDFQEMIQYFSL